MRLTELLRIPPVCCRRTPPQGSLGCRRTPPHASCVLSSHSSAGFSWLSPHSSACLLRVVVALLRRVLLVVAALLRMPPVCCRRTSPQGCVAPCFGSSVVSLICFMKTINSIEEIKKSCLRRKKKCGAVHMCQTYQRG